MTSLSRRGFLRAAGGSGAALVVGVHLPGCASTARLGPRGELIPNAWIRVAPDDTVTFVLDRVEMGQGVMTSHAMIVAEELYLRPERLRIELAPADRSYDNPELGFQITGGSTSVHSSWDALRNAGATTFVALRRAASEHLGVPLEGLRAADAAFTSTTGARVRYGELTRAARALLPSSAPPKAPADYTVIGTAVPRLDVLAKVTGRAEFGIDVVPPDLRVAVIVRGPFGVPSEEAERYRMKNLGATLVSFDAEEARRLPGVQKILQVPTGVAVVADTYWHARTAAQRVKVQWAPSTLSSTTITQQLVAALDADDGKVVRDDGDAEAALARAERVLEAEYELPYLAHATMEPQSCTAHVHAGGVEVWASTQSQGAARALAAHVAGVSEHQVVVHGTLVGGGFGRRLEQDYVAEAVDLSKRLGQCVKVMWSREDDFRHSMYRPISRHRLRVGVAGGRASGWSHHVATPSIVAHVAPNWGRNTYPGFPGVFSDALAGLYEGTIEDATAVEGAKELPYALGDVQVAWSWVDPGLPLGFYRSVGHSFNAFVVETMIDELAVALGQDPYAYRHAQLASSPRHRAVLELAAKASGWGTPLPAGRGRGIAQHASFGSFAAAVVEVSLGPTGLVFHKVTAAVDCGRVINPDIVRMQVEGAVVFALSAVQYGEITLADGWVQQRNYHEYPMLRMAQAPAVDVHVVPSEAAPTGIGEPGVPPVMAAVANALYQVTGERARKLPLRR